MRRVGAHRRPLSSTVVSRRGVNGNCCCGSQRSRELLLAEGQLRGKEILRTEGTLRSQMAACSVHPLKPPIRG